MANDIENLLREAMAQRAQGAPTPPDLGGRAQARVQRRRRALTGIGVAAAVCVALAVVRLSNGFDEPEAMTAATPSDLITLPSSGWEEGEGGNFAMLMGTLETANGDCFYAALPEGGGFMGLLWPEGWSAQRSADGFVVLDDEGAIALHEGNEFEVAGAVHDRSDVCGLGAYPVFAMQSRPTAGH